MSSLKNQVAQSFLDIATAIESGNFGSKQKIGLTMYGSEHGIDELLSAANLAKSNLYEIVLIGPKVESDFENIVVAEEEMYAKMEELLDTNYISSCITLHYSFDIGTSTVGRVSTPALGREMFIASTTGTSATTRTKAMFLNAIYGIISAKACGIKNPSVGILNVDNANAVERALRKLASNGYPINFAVSNRSDKGTVLRGNDALMGTSDVLVMDSLTGNIMMKMFSAYNTGGNIEASGYGYGPGINLDMKRCILIVSRASGASVIANAIKYAFELIENNLYNIIESEKTLLMNAGFNELLKSLEEVKKEVVKKQELAKEVVTHEISGIDIMDLESAVDSLANIGIYAQSGMGCTGPIILVNESKQTLAREELRKVGYIG